MSLIRQAVRRPVAVSMLSLVVLATGIASLVKLPLEISPEVDFPKLSVATSWGDTSPEIVEAFVTSQIEAAASSAVHVRDVSSVTTEGSSEVTVEYSRGTDMDFAAMDMNEKLSQIRRELPAGAAEPRIIKYVPRDFRRDNAFFSVRISGPYTVQVLRKIGLERVRPVLLGLDGIADVSVIGGNDRTIRITLNKAAMRTWEIESSQVRAAVLSLGGRKSVGAVSEGNRRMTLFVDNPVENTAVIEDVVLKQLPGGVIRLRDVARVEDAFGEARSISRINGDPAVMVNIAKEAGRNAVKVSDRISARLEELSRQLPPGLTLTVLSDQSQDIRTHLRGLGQRAFFSVVVIFLVLLMFLNSWRAPLIILSTIFFSVLFAMNLFIMAGMTLNLLTLAGLALGFGMLVDNAIVVVENISRHRRQGVPVQEAAVQASSEVVMPVIAATMTTLAAFIPFLYLTGELRLYYLPFTLAVGMSLISSLLVAFTLTPALTSRMFAARSRGSERVQVFSLLPHFNAFLRFILNHRGTVFLAALVIVGGCTWLFVKYVPQGRIWRFGSGGADKLRASIYLPRGSRLELADELIKRFEEKALGKPWVETVTTSVTPEYSSVTVSFPADIVPTVYPYILKEQLGMVVTEMSGISLGVSGFGDPIWVPGGSLGYPSYSNRLQILGYNYNRVKEIAVNISKRLKRHVRVKDVNIGDSGYMGRGGGDMSEIVLRLDRERLARFDLQPQMLLMMIQQHLRESLGGSTIKVGLEAVDFSLKFEAQGAFTIEDLRGLLVPLPGGGSLRLEDVSYIAKQKTMGRIERKNQQYVRTLSFDFRGPWKLASRLQEEIVRTTHLPPGYRLQEAEYSWMSSEEKGQIYYVLAISLFLVFLVTAGLFESLVHPFLILLTVPLSLSGVFLIFYLTGTNFDRSAYIGVVLLGGIVVNDSILLVDHINLERRRGLGIIEAVMTGTADRLRPILMTTFTTIGGLLPLVLLNTGENMWYSLALATIGGLLASTTLVLTVIPALYVSVEKGLALVKRRRSIR